MCVTSLPLRVSKILPSSGKAVVAHGASLGIAVDPDVDRCVLIDETGKPLGEEYTLGLAVQLVVGEFGERTSFSSHTPPPGQRH